MTNYFFYNTDARALFDAFAATVGAAAETSHVGRLTLIAFLEIPRRKYMAEIQDREAQQGERMIEVKIRFWTNDIADGEGVIRPKHAWSSGVVRMERNQSHGIAPQAPLPFHSLMDLLAVIEKTLLSHEVRLHPSRRMAKYFDPDPSQ